MYLDLGMAQETEIIRAVRTVIDKKEFLAGGMRIVTTSASQFLPVARRVKASHDGMIVAEPVSPQDVLPAGLVRMAILADHADLLSQEIRSV